MPWSHSVVDFYNDADQNNPQDDWGDTQPDTTVSEFSAPDEQQILAWIDSLYASSSTVRGWLDGLADAGLKLRIGQSTGTGFNQEAVGSEPAYLGFNAAKINSMYYFNDHGMLVQEIPELTILHEFIHYFMGLDDLADGDNDGNWPTSLDFNTFNYNVKGDTVVEQNDISLNEMGITTHQQATYQSLFSGTGTFSALQTSTSYTESNQIDSARVGSDFGSLMDMSNRTDNSRDLILAMGGDDTIRGGGGVDYLYGGLGIDTIEGGDESDVLYGDDFDRTLTTGAGDLLDGGDGSDRIYGGAGGDTIEGGAGEDDLYGDAGDDVISGGADNDEIFVVPNGGFDDVSGGTGYDTIKANADNTIIGLKSLSGIEEINTNGHAGVSIAIQTGATVDFTGVSMVGAIQIVGGVGGASITGSAGADTILGDISSDLIHGGAGDDSISCLAGNDTLYGDDGNDTLDGGEGIDILDGGAGEDILHGGVGSDVLTASSGLDQLFGDDDDDTLVSSVDGVKISGGAGDDVIDARGLPQTDQTYLNYHTWYQYDGAAVEFGYGDGHDTILYDTLTANYSPLDAQHYGNTKSYSGISFLDMRDVPMSDVEIHLNVTAQYTYISPIDGRLLVSGDAVVTLELISTGETINIGSHKVYFIDWSKRTTTGGYSDNNIWNNYPIAFQGDDINDPAFQNIGSAHLCEIAESRGVIIDSLNGGDGNEQLRSDGADETIGGGGGDDEISDTGGNDTLSGDGGVDTLSYASASGGVQVNLSLTTAQNTGGAGVDTLSSFENVTGTNFNDALTGDSGANALVGNAGDDELEGGAGADTLTGGAGFDTAVFAGASSDYTVTLYGSYITVTHIASGDVDTLTGMEAMEFSDGTSGVTYASLTVTGTSGADVLSGELGADTIIGLGGDDTLNGNDGDDLFEIGLGHGVDIINGGAGADTVAASADNVAIGLRSFSSLEAITSGGFTGVTIIGSSSPDTLDFSGVALTGIVSISGGDGYDTIIGSAGADTLIGANGYDTLYGGNGDDIFLVGLGDNRDAFDGGAGLDTIFATANNVAIGIEDFFAGIEAVSANGFTGVSIVGSPVDDLLDFSNTVLTGITKIDGGSNDDTIIGSAGADVIEGNNGNDTLAGGDGDDVFLFASSTDGVDSIDGGAGYDELRAAANSTTIRWSSLTNVEGISAAGYTGLVVSGSSGADVLDFSAMTLTGSMRLDGGAGDDVITGNAANNVIQGSGGDDILAGGDGADLFYYTGSSGGFDTVDGGAGADELRAIASNTVIGIVSVTGIEAVNGQTYSNVTIAGTSGNDAFNFSAITLSGIAAINLGSGDDTIMGLTANVTLNGGDGTDALYAVANGEVLTVGGISGFETVSAAGFTGVTISGSTAADVMDFTGTTLIDIGSISGGAGADTITGSSVNDLIIGGTGDDVLNGGDGDDDFRMAVGDGFDTVNGGAGADRVLATAAGQGLGLRSVSGIEEISANGFAGVAINGSSVADTLDFSSTLLTGITKIDGGSGNDVIIGSAAADTIQGSAGDDSLAGGGANDIFLYTGTSSGFDSVDGGAGADEIRASANSTVIGLTSVTGVETITALTFTGVTISGSAAADTFDFSAVTLTGITAINLGDGADSFIGSATNDTINGGLGDDQIAASGGAGAGGFDAIDGGTGNDTLYATADNQVISVRNLSNLETITANGFTNVSLKGSTGADVINLTGATLIGISSISGDAGADTITGSAGADIVVGGVGDDVMSGGGGDDTFLIAVGDGFDSITGGAGYDVMLASANGQGIGLKAASGLEEVNANGFTGVVINGYTTADTLDFTGAALIGITSINGGAGNDTITGSAGADTIVGGTGDDVLNGGDGDDTFLVAVGDGFDSISGGAGYDVVLASANSQGIGMKSAAGLEEVNANGFTGVVINGSTVNDVLDFSATALIGITKIDAGSGNDTITGSTGADTIQGSAGDDILAGGDGADAFLYTGSTGGFDTVNGGAGADEIRALANSTVIGLKSLTGVETITAGAFTGVTIAGSAVADTLDFSAVTLTGITKISAGAGDDTLTGSSAADVLMGGAGRDTLTGGSGADIFDYDATTESAVGANRDVITDFLAGSDKIDVSTIDANSVLTGSQAFAFIGTAAFSAAGQLRVDDTDPLKTIVMGDVNGDGVADFQIELTGSVSLAATDFFL